jgi:hypothetical protein
MYFLSRFLARVKNKVLGGEAVLRNIKRYWGSSIHLCFKMFYPPTLLNAS